MLHTLLTRRIAAHAGETCWTCDGTTPGRVCAPVQSGPTAVVYHGRVLASAVVSGLHDVRQSPAPTRAAQAVWSRVRGWRPDGAICRNIIAFLAILKAGGVYLPLDPAYPPDRLEYMASDAGATLVLDSWSRKTKPAPLGWSETGPSGSKEEVLEWVKANWTDMRPISMRNAPPK